MDDKKISASEVNRYLYCNYQWYYEKKYSRSYITKLYKERNEMLSLNDSTKSNFAKGLDFHNKYRLSSGVFGLFKILVMIVVFIIIFFLLYQIL